MDDMEYYDSYPDGDSAMYYDDSSIYEDEFDPENFAPPYYSIKELWDDCLMSTISDGITASTRLLICCLLLHLTSTLGFLPSFVLHLTSGIAGVYCLHNFFGWELIYVVILAILGYTTVFSVHSFFGKHRGVICAVVCFLFLITCELFFVEHTLWHRIRGSQMVLAMKLISLAFDMDHSGLALPSVISCFGYLFSVGTVIFGPWISYSSYVNVHQYKSVTLWALRIVWSLLLSVSFLTVSTCWSSWIFQYTSWKTDAVPKDLRSFLNKAEHPRNSCCIFFNIFTVVLRWLAAYRDAVSFRSSHYFISYLSEATAVSSGLSSSSGTWGFPVAQPDSIEIPRSLVEVVICWNLPMHFWLKTYVFKTAKPLGNFVAVLLTYAVSSLLHGLNFQLAAVLLSLGFYTYIEYELRKKLAAAFNACILARKCKKGCSHIYKHDHPYSRIANVAFGILAMFHLAYLGVMFDSSSSLQEEGYSMKHTLEKWSELDFASHWVAFATYLFYILI